MVDVVWCRVGVVAAVGVFFMTGAGTMAREGKGAFATREAFDALMQRQGTSCLTHADDGEYAWGESYVMMGLITMYRVTGEHRYLDRFIEHADVVLSKRDSILGRKDYRGRSLPGWGVGKHYSIGEIRLRDAKGRAVLYLRSSLTGYNNETMVTVRPGKDASHFHLHILNAHYHREDDFKDLSMDPGAADYAVERIRASKLAQPFSFMRLAVKDLRPHPETGDGGIPVPGEFAMRTSRMLWPVHQGMILEPMTLFARLVHETESLRRVPEYRQRAATYQAAAEDLFRVMEERWRTNDKGEGWYDLEKGAPVWFDGCDEPHNHALAMGCAMLHLAAISPDPTWRRHVECLARWLRNDMRLEAEKEAYIWPYWWRGGKVFNGWSPADGVSRNTPGMYPIRSMVDFSHASIDVGFAYHCFKDGIVFTRQDMIRLGNTFTRNIVRHTPEGKLTFSARVDGKGTPGTYDLLGPNWVLLSEFRPEILERFQEIRRDSPWNGYALWMLQSANMNLMRSRLGAKDTPPGERPD